MLHFRGLIVVMGFAIFYQAGLCAELISSTEKGWPQFRGPRRDGTTSERSLLQQWPESGPRLIWSVTNAGFGFSSPVIHGDRIIITGDTKEKVVIRSFDLAGNSGWSVTNGESWKHPYPGARSTPTISDGRVYHQNAHGRLVSLDLNSGRELWVVNTLATFGGRNIEWGLAECLLVDDRAVYVTTGADEASIVALDKRNGNVLWKAPAIRDASREQAVESASYVSPILVRFGAKRLLIGCTLRHLYCVDADSGAVQWTEPMPTAYSVLALTPALIGDGIFMTAPHGKGGRLLRLKQDGAKTAAESVWRTDLDTCQGGVVHADGRIIGSFYPGRKGWGAIDARNGSVLYQLADYAKGAPLLADGRVYAFCEDGWMLLLEPKATEFDIKGKFRFANARARDAWAHPVILDERLYLRYHDTLSCFDVRNR